MNSVTENHTKGLFCLFIENFKNLLFTSLITGICLIYQVFHCHKDEEWEEYAPTYYEALNHTLYRDRWSSPNTFYGLEAYDTY